MEIFTRDTTIKSLQESAKLSFCQETVNLQNIFFIKPGEDRGGYKTVIQITNICLGKQNSVKFEINSMMTSTNGNIFRVTGPLWWLDSPRKGQ